MESASRIKNSDTCLEAVEPDKLLTTAQDASKELLIPNNTENVSSSNNSRKLGLDFVYSHDDINPNYTMKIISLFLCLLKCCGMIEII